MDDNFNNFLELDNVLMNLSFGNYCYEEIMKCLQILNDPISKIISKYNLKKVNTIDDNDAKTLSSLNTCKSIFCVWLINIYLLYSQKTYCLSKAYDNCIIFTSMMFDSFKKDGKINFSIYTYISLLSLMIKKISLENRQKLSQYFVETLNQCKIKPVHKLYILYEFCSNDCLMSFFTNEQWNSFIELCGNKNLYAKNEIYEVYDYFDCFLNILSPKVIKRSKIQNLICEFIINNIDFFDNSFIHLKLPLIRDYLDELKIYSDKIYNLFDTKIEQANLTVISGLHNIDIKLPDRIIEQFNDKLHKVEDFFKSLKPSDMIDYLLFYVVPLDLDDIKKYIEQTSKNSLLSSARKNYLDANGAVINYKELKIEEQLSLDAGVVIINRIKLFIDMYYRPFCSSFVLNAEVENYIKEILEKSFLIPKEDIKKTYDIITLFFENKYKESVGKLVINLESNLRKYFKDKGLNIYKRDGSHDFIDLNYIFNNNCKNSFRECLFDRIDENYYFTLKWLLTDKYGFNLRNAIAHDLGDENILETYLSIYASLQIIRLYFYFRD